MIWARGGSNHDALSDSNVIGVAMCAQQFNVRSRRPKLRRLCSALSPAARRSGSGRATPRRVFDDAADFTRHDLFARTEALGRLNVRVDVGRDDPFAPVTRDLLRAVASIEGGVRPGGHNAATWRSFVRDQLVTIGRWLADASE